MPQQEYHVALSGSNANPGTIELPLRTIQAAADLAQPGDRITVHEGEYREYVDPPRGGLSDEQRITYQAAEGEEVTIKGSESLTGWVEQANDVWMVRIDNDFFGSFNPFANPIAGDWFFPQGRKHHTAAVYINGEPLGEADCLDTLFVGRWEQWYAAHETNHTLVWAKFPGKDPNTELVEVNTRQTVFYPSQPGINYLTVRGFNLTQAATPWSPPTTEQIGLIGVNWSKGWIIEENTITHSRCTGLTLGKYFDRADAKIAYGFNAHYQTVKRVLERGDWTEENIGHHLVRNNHIAYCEQAGIVGSHGGAFSTITGNVIHDIHLRSAFGGYEQAGIKLHAPVDTTISNNLIYNCNMGMWLDWMVQGTRISSNTFHSNKDWDLFIEISHGPALIDNNLLLSKVSLLDSAQGGAYVHNLFAGAVRQRTEYDRHTQFFKPHSTDIAGTARVLDGDDRFYNNIVMEDSGLGSYDNNEEALSFAGNLYLYRAQATRLEENPTCIHEADTRFHISEENGEVYLELKLESDWNQEHDSPLVTTELLGKTNHAEQEFDNTDGSPLMLNQDYFGKERDTLKPFPGPIELSTSVQKLKIWPANDQVRVVGGTRKEVEAMEVEPR